MEGFYFTETACAVILMPSLKYVNMRRELTLQKLGLWINDPRAERGRELIYTPGNPIHATTRNYNSVYLLSLGGGFGDATRAIEVEDRNLRRHGAGGLLRRRRTGHESATRQSLRPRARAGRRALRLRHDEPRHSQD